MSSRARVRHTRKRRRQNRDAGKFGPTAKPSHQLRSGRTGKAHAKKLQSQRPPKKSLRRAA